MAINLICSDGVKEINTGDLSRLYKTPHDGKTRSRSDSITHAQSLLMKYLEMSEEETEKVCEKYGYYGGAIQFLLKRLGMTHDEAYEKGILYFPKPIDKCDEEHHRVLEEYRRIRIEKGIKEANKYFLGR